MSIIQHPVSVTFYRNIRHTIKNLHTISRNMYDHTAFAKYMFDHLLSMWFFFQTNLLSSCLLYRRKKAPFLYNYNNNGVV